MSRISRRDLLCFRIGSFRFLSARSLRLGTHRGTACAIRRRFRRSRARRRAARALLFDFGWKFSSATAPIRQGIWASAYGQGDFAKTGDFKFAKAGFDDSKWRTLNLPHDWAVELPFVHDDEQNVARLQAAGPALSRDQRGLVSARVRNSGQRPGPPHLRSSSTAPSATCWSS